MDYCKADARRFWTFAVNLSVAEVESCNCIFLPDERSANWDQEEISVH